MSPSMEGPLNVQFARQRIIHLIYFRACVGRKLFGLFRISSLSALIELFIQIFEKACLLPAYCVYVAAIEPIPSKKNKI